MVEEGETSAVFRISALQVLYVCRAATQEHSVIRGPRTFSDIVREYAVVGRRSVPQDFDSFSERRACSRYRKGPHHQQTLKRDQKMAQEAPETGIWHQA